MRIRHNIKREGCTLSGQILETIFEEGEERGDIVNQFTKDKQFYIVSTNFPQLSRNCLYVHWTLSVRDNNKLSYAYPYEQEAQEVLDYINEFSVNNEDQTEPKIAYVYVSNDSEEHALKKKNKYILITKFFWKARYPYICVDYIYEEEYLKWEEYLNVSWKYAVPVPIDKKKLRELYLTDAEYEKLTNLIK